jgi:hypothetical protein
MASVTVAEKVQQYIRLRDYKKAADEEFKKSMERVNKAMGVLETELHQMLLESGADHIGCETGTVYLRTELSCTVDDRDAFLQYCIENEEWDALDVKANKTFARELMHKGETLPPGVNVSTYQTVGVRR